MFDDWQSILWVVGAILGAYGAVLWLGITVWTYLDMRDRTQDGWSQAMTVLLVLLFNIPGLFLYLLLRPHETLSDGYQRRLEAEALMRDLAEQRRSCPRCQRPVKEEFLLCPHCRTKLQEPCSGCGRALDLGWIACPYCGAQGPQPATPSAETRTPQSRAPGRAPQEQASAASETPATPEAGASSPAAPASDPTPPSQPSEAPLSAPEGSRAAGRARRRA